MQFGEPVCDVREEKNSFLWVHCCEAEDAYGERENGLAKAKDQHIKSRIGILALQSDRVYFVCCGPPAGIQIYFARSTAAGEMDFWRAQ
jgi:hypothetical protein